MSIHCQRRLRSRYAATLIVFSTTSGLTLSLSAAPVDRSGQPEIALTEPGSVKAIDPLSESSILAPAEADSVSISDLPNATENELESKPVDASGLVTPSPSDQLQTRFADGKLQIERYVAEDTDGNLVNHGPYKEYDKSGTLIRSGKYEMGKLDGTWSQVISIEAVQSLTSRLDAGFKPPFKSEAQFVLGQLHGDWTVIDSKGNPVFVWQFEFDKRENVSTWFDSRHTAVLEILYKDGVPNGPSTQAVSGQREPKRIVYDRGRIVQTKTNWYEQGKRKRSEENHLVPAANLLVSHDWWTSSVKSDAPAAVEPVRHGAYVTWHPNGQKSFEGNFDNGKPSGAFHWWYSNGQPQTKGHYEEGNSIGEWVWWHPNGMKMMEGSYDSGKQIGQWSQWDTNGSLTLRDDAARFPVIQQELKLDASQTAETKSHVNAVRTATSRTMSRQSLDARAASTRMR